jgi:hypothetical protein
LATYYYGGKSPFGGPGEKLGKQTRRMSHCNVAIYIEKYLMESEELWKLKYVTMQKYNLKKIL